MKERLAGNFWKKFRDNDRDIPVICTSSQMPYHRVDARNVRILSGAQYPVDVEFKQISGGHTAVLKARTFQHHRLHRGKRSFFTILLDGEPGDGSPR